MKSYLTLLAGMAFPVCLLAQRVGINTPNPAETFSVNGTVLVDQDNHNNGGFQNGNLLKFGTAGNVGIGSTKTVGPMKNGLTFFTNGLGHIFIDTVGGVGLGAFPATGYRLYANGNAIVSGNTTVQGGMLLGANTGDLVAYRLDVNGHSRVRNNLYVNEEAWIDGNLDVDGTTSLFGNVSAGSNVAVSGNLTVDAGRGIVRSASSTQQVVAYPSGSVGFTNAPAGHTQDVEFVFSNVFAGAPWIGVAHVTNGTGTFERWTYTIHSINLATRRFMVRFYNASALSSTFTMTLNFIAIGPAL